jgi:hypothetical protein
MSADNKQRKRNTQIPLEAIECAAGKNDITEMDGYVVAVDCAREVETPNKNNTNTVIGDSYARDVVISTELQPGMTIVAKNGGIEAATKKETDRDR